MGESRGSLKFDEKIYLKLKCILIPFILRKKDKVTLISHAKLPKKLVINFLQMDLVSNYISLAHTPKDLDLTLSSLEKFYVKGSKSNKFYDYFPRYISSEIFFIGPQNCIGFWLIVNMWLRGGRYILLSFMVPNLMIKNQYISRFILQP